jgi:cytochrome c-type biogenesis protein CcmE
MNRASIAKIVGSIALVGGAIAIVVITARQSAGLFRFVDEVQRDRKKLEGREFWLAGEFVRDSHDRVSRPGKRQRHTFRVSHRNVVMTVTYVGEMPHRARPGRQLIMRGRLGPRNTFVAHEIRTKCPSKYKSQYQARR